MISKKARIYSRPFAFTTFWVSKLLDLLPRYLPQYFRTDKLIFGSGTQILRINPLAASIHILKPINDGII